MVTRAGVGAGIKCSCFGQVWHHRLWRLSTPQPRRARPSFAQSLLAPNHIFVLLPQTSSTILPINFNTMFALATFLGLLQVSFHLSLRSLRSLHSLHSLASLASFMLTLTRSSPYYSSSRRFAQTPPPSSPRPTLSSTKVANAPCNGLPTPPASGRS